MEHPGILLGRIATRIDVQKSGRRIGSSLLWHAICRSTEIASLVGGRFIVLDAKDEKLAAWYEKDGFVPLKNNRLRMVLPMKRAREMLEMRGEGV